MKYLVLTRHKDAFLMLPAEQRMAIWEGTIAYIENYKKMGKCKDIYMDADMQGSASIWEINSEEEATKTVFDNPMAPFMNMEIRPVVGWDIALSGFNEHYQK